VGHWIGRIGGSVVGSSALHSTALFTCWARWWQSGLPDRVVRETVRSRSAVLGDLAELAPWQAGEAKRLHPSDIVGAGRAIAAFDARPWFGELACPPRRWSHAATGPSPDKQRATAVALDGAVIEVYGGHAACATDPEVLLGAAVGRAVDLVVASPRAAPPVAGPCRRADGAGQRRRGLGRAR